MESIDSDIGNLIAGYLDSRTLCDLIDHHDHKPSSDALQASQVGDSASIWLKVDVTLKGLMKWLYEKIASPPSPVDIMAPPLSRDIYAIVRNDPLARQSRVISSVLAYSGSIARRMLILHPELVKIEAPVSMYFDRVAYPLLSHVLCFCAYDLVPMVIAMGANVDQRFEDPKSTYSSALELAAWSGDIDLFKLLYERSQDTDLQHLALNVAVIRNKTDIVNFLLNNDAERHLQLVARLLDDGADVNQKNRVGDTLLCLEARQYCADPSADVMDQIRFLLRKGASLDHLPNNIYLLHKAAINGHRLLVEELLDAGADPNQVDSEGSTPLSLAVEHYCGNSDLSYENVLIICDLLKNGALVTAQHTQRLLRIALAFTHGGEYRHLCHLLVEKGVDIRAANASGYTVLMAAVGEAHPITKRYFVNYAQENDAAALRAVDQDGMTLLMYAVSDRRCEADIVAMIMRNGVDPNQQCNRGLTALDYAVHNGCQHGVEVLRAHNYHNKGVFATARDLFCSLLCLSTAVVSLVLLPVGWTMALLLVGAVGLFSLMQWNHHRYYNSLFGASFIREASDDPIRAYHRVI